MDEATAIQILKQYGVQPTPENMQRVMQQAPGSDGSAVLGRSMGLQGGMDESGNALDKLAFASQRNAPTNAAAVPATTPIPANTPPITPPLNRAPTPAPKQQFGPPEPTGPPIPAPSNTTMPAGGDSSFLPWILAALGISSAAGRAGMAPGANASVPDNAQITGPEARQALPDNTGKLRLEAPLKQLTGPTPETNAVGKAVPPSQRSNVEAVDKIAGDTSRTPESRRPINTNTDERNSELVNKPTNLDTKAPIKGAYDGEPVNLVEEIAKFLKKGRR